jgi:hypothetical protein
MLIAKDAGGPMGKILMVSFDETEYYIKFN